MTDDRSPQLIWTPEGAPQSGRFGDIYFSREDGLAESRAVFLEGCGLPDAWAGRKQFTVGELGFGTGLNIVALLDLWRREGPGEGRLNIFSIEAFPLTRDEAARALSAWPETAEAVGELIPVWPAGTPGFHRVDMPGFRATLDLAVGDAAWALEQWSGQADAWFLDGFAPATNPGMWSGAVFDGLARRSAPGARVATFTVAGAVRRGLAERGFAVEKRPGHGRKRERLEAVMAGNPAVGASDGPVVVIGGGIAGAATARALKAVGRRVVLIEAEAPGAGGSGFPAALVTPRLDAGDAGIAGLYAQSLERAGHLYRTTPGAVLVEGVVQLEGAIRDGPRFVKVAAQPIWPDGAMAPLTVEAASARMGEPVEIGGLEMALALAVRPEAILTSWLDGVDHVRGRVTQLEATNGGWRVIGAAGETLAEAGQVVVTAGWGAADLAPELALRPVRGQAEWIEGIESHAAVAWGGYVVPTGTGMLFGASHDRDAVDTEVREASRTENLERLQSRLPALAARVEGRELQSRAAVRATTADRLPVAGELASGLFVLAGLGSRGFCLAPLLGEHLASLITGAPSPLPETFAARVAPQRMIGAQPTGPVVHSV